MIITFDGPSGSGKSTLAKKVSKKLKIMHIDSGSIYRTIAYYLNKNNINPEIAKSKLDNISITYDKYGVSLNGEHLKDELRTPEVTNVSSIIATQREVREKVNNIIRHTADKYSVIVDGRDIGSAVLPKANYKFYIDASASTRARRRYNQLKRKGLLNGKTYNEILQDIEERDKRDKEREIDPLTIPENAIIINTSNKKINDTIDEILSFIQGD
ncbi:(d)CMP kinase [uncultured Ezakiella sp.]|uniref:(d)CMP kinase n=1 Tax=uncultured Ezakiella sp. TaxID=1637529 RepID=UPI0025F54F84|nr:(d)CMP kinase [uncultured Ezakiella sp.]